MQSQDSFSQIPSNWRLTHLPSAVRLALGFKALLIYSIVFAVLLTPASLLFAGGIYSHRPALLAFALLCLCGFLTSSPSPTGIGLIANIVLVIAGINSSLIWHDSMLAVFAILPGLTWFGSCAALGVAEGYLIEELKRSEKSFQILVSRGILTAVAPASQALERSVADDHSASHSDDPKTVR